MVNEDVFIALLVVLVGAILLCAVMLLGIRDALNSIEWDLSIANLQELYRARLEEFTTENDA